jgi:hypothetical protein
MIVRSIELLLGDEALAQASGQFLHEERLFVRGSGWVWTLQDLPAKALALSLRIGRVILNRHIEIPSVWRELIATILFWEWVSPT